MLGAVVVLLFGNSDVSHPHGPRHSKVPQMSYLAVGVHEHLVGLGDLQLHWVTTRCFTASHRFLVLEHVELAGCCFATRPKRWLSSTRAWLVYQSRAMVKQGCGMNCCHLDHKGGLKTDHKTSIIYNCKSNNILWVYLFTLVNNR